MTFDKEECDSNFELEIRTRLPETPPILIGTRAARGGARFPICRNSETGPAPMPGPGKQLEVELRTAGAPARPVYSQAT